MQSSSSYVLDSYALIGYFENEPFADRIQRFLTRAKSGELSLYLHMIHLGEVYYITLKNLGRSVADLAYSMIKALPLQLVQSIEEDLLLAAASLKADHPISYADSFAAALAMINRCPLLTGDPEFKSVEKQGIIAVEWLQ